MRLNGKKTRQPAYSFHSRRASLTTKPEKRIYACLKEDHSFFAAADDEVSHTKCGEFRVLRD